MEAYPASEIGEVLERISGLQRTAHSLRVLRRELTALIPQAQSSLCEHEEYVRGKMASLTKYTARLDSALPWAMETRARLAIASSVPVDREELQTSVNDKEAEIREVIENFNNIERECVAAKQTVSPEVRERVLKLKEDWTFIRSQAP